MEEFEHVGTTLERVTKTWNVDFSKRFFGLSDCPDSEIEEEAARLTSEEEWLRSVPQEVRKIYAMAVRYAAAEGKPRQDAHDPVWMLDEEGEIVGKRESVKPFRYSFEGFRERCDHPKMLKLAERMGAIARGESRRGVFVWGEPGTYKTWLMMALMYDALERGEKACVYPVKSLVEDVQSTYADTSQRETQRRIFDLVLTNTIICLDDLGREKGSEDAARIVSDFVDAVYRKQDTHTLIVATNLTKKAIPQTYEPAVLSRIKGMCDGFEIPISDTRGEVIEESPW